MPLSSFHASLYADGLVFGQLNRHALLIPLGAPEGVPIWTPWTLGFKESQWKHRLKEKGA